MVTETFEKSVHNEAIVAGIVDAFQQADYTALSRLIAHDVAWTIPGTSPLAGSYRGRDELLGVLGAMNQLSEGTFSWDALSIEGDEEGATVSVRIRAARNGRCVQYENVVSVRIQAGQVVEGTDRVDDQEFVDEFWS